MDGLLTELNLGTEYRSDTSDTIKDFYLPCLQRSSVYRRAVGYFTSRGLAVAAQGVAALLSAGGVMRLVASPRLEADDLEAIRKGYVAREDVVIRALIASIENVEDEIVRDRLGVLAWLVAEGRLDVRIAVPLYETGEVKVGIYHEKLGLFSDDAGNVVAFTGSPNETAGGLVDNFETIDVFCSWDDPQCRVARKIDNFERLWSNKTKGLSVLDFPAAVREQLLKYRNSRTGAVPPTPPVVNRWQHQEDAISKFLDCERGVLEM